MDTLLYRVRPAAPDDAAAVRAIYAPVVEHTAISFEEVALSADEMRARITATAATYPYLVAKDAREGALRVLGYAYASPTATARRTGGRPT